MNVIISKEQYRAHLWLISVYQGKDLVYSSYARSKAGALAWARSKGFNIVEAA
jgi:hypothetical protein